MIPKYASNVAKSVGFISVQVIKGLNPTLTSYVQESASTIKDAYDSVKGKGSDIKGFFSDYGSLAKEGFGNAIDDLKTGKWYNPDRANKNMSAAFGFDDEDMSDWFNDDDDDMSSSENAAKNENSVAMAAVAGTIVNTSNNSTVRLTRSARQNTQAMMMHNEKMFKSLTSSVLSVNNTLMSIYSDISKPLNAHMQNTYNFQLASIDEMKKQTDYLKTIAGILQNRYGDDKKNGFGKKPYVSNWDKTFGGNKLPSLKGIMDVAKKEVMDNTGLGSMLDLLFDRDFLDPKMIKATDMFNSPIAALITMAASGAARRSSFGQGLNKIVGRLPMLLNSGLHKANEWGRKNNDGIIGELLQSITGAFIPRATKDKLDPSKYNKGRMDWNGMADKALREVIPTQLAQILSAITGQEAKVFNYSTGKWETISSTVKNFKNQEQNAINSATSGFLGELRQGISDKYGYTGRSSKAMASIANDYNNFMKIVASSPGLNLKSVSEIRTYLRKLGAMRRSGERGPEPLIHEENFNLIIKTINSHPGMKSSFTYAMDSAINARNRHIANMNESGDFGSYNAIVSGSGLTGTAKNGYGSILGNSVDNKGNNIFFYLQNYYSDLKRIAHNIEISGGRTVGVKASFRKNNFDVPDNTKASTVNNKYNKFGSRTKRYYSINDASSREIMDKKEREDLAKQEKNDNSLFGRIAKIIKPDDSKANAFADSFTKSIESFIYGTNGDDGVRKFGIVGFIKTMSENIQSIATQFKQVITEFVREKTEKFANKAKAIYGNWKKHNKRFVKRFKKSFIDDGLPGAYKRAFSEVASDGISGLRGALSKYNATVKRFGGESDNSGKNYRGGMVEKTGLAAVSEGELIIPSKDNPYYDGFYSEGSQSSKEGSIIENFLSEVKDRMYGSYSGGGTARSKNSKNNSNNKKKDNKKPKSATGKVLKAGAKVAKKAAPIVKGEFVHIGEDLKSLASEAAETVSIVANNALYKVNQYLNAHFGDSKFYQSINKFGSSEVGKEIKKYVPEGLAGGLTGALVGGGLTGSGVGVLGGFTIGAGINIIRKSKVISEKLFGKEDKTTGKMTGGFFNRDISTFIKKRLPKTVKPGLIGSIVGASLLPQVGIFGGFALGAGLELVSTTETFKNIFLGEVGVDGKRRGGIKGMFESRVIQPLSNFVKGGIDKVTDYFKKHVLNPLGRLFNPLKDLTVGVINGIGSKLYKGLMGKVIEPFAHTLDRVFKPITSIVGKVGKFGIKVASGLATAPGAIVGGVGDIIGRFNARHGFSTANAKERVRLNNTYLRNKFVNHFGLENTKFGKWAKVKSSRNMYDEFAARDDVTSEDIQEYMNVAKGNSDYDIDINEAKQKYLNLIYGTAKNGGLDNKKDFADIKKYLRSSDSNFIDKNKISQLTGDLLNKGIINEEQMNALISESDNLKSNIDAITKNKLDNAKNREAFLEKHKALGIDKSIFDDQRSFENLKRTVNADYKFKKKEEEEAARKAIEEAKANKAKMEEIRENNPLEAQTADNTKNTANIAEKILEKISENSNSTASNTPTVPGAPIPHFTATSHGKEVEADGEVHNLGETKTVETDNGPITYVWTNSGWKEDVRDSETAETKKKNEEDRELKNGFFSQFMSGSFMTGLKSVFGFGDKDNENKKPSFLQEMLSKMVGFLGALPVIATGVAGLAAAASLFNPKKSLGENIANAPEASNKLEATLLGYKRQKYNDGEYQENYTATRAMNILMKRVITGRTIGKAVPGIVRAPANLVIKGTHSLLNAGVNKVTKAAGAAITKSIEKGGVMGKIFGFLQTVITKMASKLGGNAAKEAAETATKGIFSQLLEKGGQQLSKAIAKHGFTIAFVLLAAENGWEDAQANIGMLEKPTIGERFLSSIIAAVNELALGIIPVPILINIVLGIGGLFGIDISGIRQKQEAAKAEWQQWNKEHPDQTYNTLKEYLKNHYGLLTTQDRIAGAAKAGLKIAGKAIGGIGKGIVSAGKAVGKGVAFVGDVAVKGVKAYWGGVGKVAKTVGGAAVNIAKGAGKAIGGIGNGLAGGINGALDLPDMIHQKVNDIFFKPIGDIFSKFGKFVGDPKKFATNNPATMLADLWKETDPDYTGPSKVEENKTPVTVGYDLVRGRTSLVDIIINMGKGLMRIMTAPVFNLVKGFRWVAKKVKDLDIFGVFKSDNKESATGTPTTSATEVVTGGSSHVSQYDPRFKNRVFGKSNIADNGCGPAVAATVLRSYGKNGKFEDAINFAEKNGYVAGASGVTGTRASYFQDILGSNGISTAYTNNSNTIRKAIGSGSPTILLGQDRNNTSKSNSPFGPNPHYVVARGTDSRGNVFIDDPELNRTALYSKDILNSAKLGVMTGGASGTDADYIGKYVKKYESGDKGSKMISSGNGDHGGVSFGTYQFPSNGDAGNLKSFWKKYYADKFPGVEPGNNKAFKDAWLKAVDMDPHQFFKNEYSIEYGHYLNNLNSLIAKNPSFNPNTFSRGTQEAFWSSSVQYGGGKLLNNPFSQAGLNMSMNKDSALDLIYKYKIDNVDSNFKSSSTAVRNGIRKRYQNELNYLKGINNDPLAPGLVPDGVVSGGSGGSGYSATSSGGQQSSNGNQYNGFTMDFLKDALSVALNKAITGTTNSSDPNTPNQPTLFGKIGNFLGSFFKTKSGFTSTINQADNSTSFSNAGGMSTGESGSGDIINNFPYYNQGDPNWGQKGYGKGTISSSGCGPTSMAMVMKSYGRNVTPVDTVQYSLDHGFRINGQGTSWDFFANIGKANGLTVEQYDGGQRGIDVTKAKLASNIPVIGSMRPGDFTKGGHFIVFSGLDSDGTIRVNDPSSRERSTKKWDPQHALSQAKQFWAISKDGKGSIKQSAEAIKTAEASKIGDSTLSVAGFNANTAIAKGSGIPIYDFTKKYGNKYYGRGTELGETLTSNIVKLSDQNSVLGNPTIDRIIELLTTIAQNTTNNRVLPSVVSILKSCLQVISNMNIDNTDDEALIQDMNNELVTMMSRLDSLSKAI